MEPFDVKRFVTWFLILAAITTPLILILENNSSQSINSENAAQSETPKNAFEPVPSSSFAVSTPPSENNLTESLTNTLAEQIINSNPQGPQDINGVLGIASPNIQAVTEKYVASAGQTPIIPQIDEQKLNIVTKNFNQNDIVDYFAKIQEILTPLSDGSTLQSLLARRDQDQNQVDAINLFFSQMEGSLYALSVPEPLKEFHKSVLATIATQAALFDMHGADPIKTVALVQNAKEVFAVEKVNLETAVENLKNNLPNVLSYSSPKDERSIVDRMLGIQQANAVLSILPLQVVQWITAAYHAVLGALTKVFAALSEFFDASTWYGKLLTEYLKDVLVHNLVQSIINWINGGGSPQFVTNWKGFLDKAFNSVAGAIISKFAPNLCQGIGPLVKVALQPTNLGSTGFLNVGGCSLDQIVGNVKAFYNNFNNGGWIAYGQVLNPDNNLLGSIIEVRDIAITEAAKAEAAKAAEVQAGSGFNQSRKNQTCTQPQPAFQGFKTEYEGNELFVSATGCDAETGDACQITLCSPNGWQTTTPGTLLASTVNEAVGSSPAINRIVNAGDMTALVNAIVNYAINALMGSAHGLSHIDEVKDVKDAATLCAQQYPAPRDSTQQTNYDKCLAAANKAGGSTQKNNGAKASVIKEADIILEETRGSLPLLSQAIEIATSTGQTLRQVTSSTSVTPDCLYAKQQATTLLQNVDAEFNDLVAKLALANKILADLPGFENTVKTSTETDPSWYLDKLDELHNTYGTADDAALTQANAQTAVTSLKQQETTAQDLLSKCTQ